MPHQLNVVLIEPEIPMNTGSIGRLCLATGCRLHLVEPLGFEITHAKLKRAGLDYWQHVDVVIHPSQEAFFDSLPESAPQVYLSAKAKRTLFQHRFQPGSYLIFGRETKGLPKPLINTQAHQTFRIPQYDDRVRSLNLANAVGIVVYEAIRQLGE